MNPIHYDTDHDVFAREEHTNPRQIPSIIGERYEVIRELGRGAMSVVYECQDLEVGTRVAVKLLKASSPESNAPHRFLRESRIAARLQHANVVRSLRSGKHNDEQPYLVLELITGVAMQHVGPLNLTAGQCVDLAMQILDGLSYVHARGVLHRDIKPANILVERLQSGQLHVRITDFGIAKPPIDPNATRITQEGSLIGSPAYISPEQILNKPVGPSVDIYSTGVVLYELLSGKIPHVGDTATAIIMDTLSKDPQPLIPRPGVVVPPLLRQLLSKLMHRVPSERFESAAVARNALQRFAQPAVIDDGPWQAIVGDHVDAEPHQIAAASNRPSSAPFWGRTSELRALSQVATKVAGGHGAVMLVTGDVGVGKTALVQHVARELVERGRFQAMHVRFNETSGVDMGLRGAIERHIDVVGRDLNDVRLAVVDLFERYDIDDAPDAEALIEFLRPTGLPADAVMRQQESVALLIRLFRRIARRTPVMLTIDDLQAGGAYPTSLLEHFLFELDVDPARILMIATLKDGRQDRVFQNTLDRIAKYEGRTLETIRLAPLDISALQAGLASLPQVSGAVAIRAAQRSQGNPLFALHLAQSMSQAGDPTGVGFRTHDGISPNLVSVVGQYITDRINQSSDPNLVQEALTRLAVLGDAIQESLAVIALTEITEDPFSLLDQLVELNIMVDSGTTNLRFVNNLYRDVLLNDVQSRQLRARHRWAAELRMRAGQAAAEDAAGVLGDHFAGAGDRMTAVTWWLKAVDWHRKHGDAPEAARYGTLALRELDELDPRRPGCALEVARLLRGIGENELALRDLEPLLDSPYADDAIEAGELAGEIYQELGRGEDWMRVLEIMTRRAAASGRRGRLAMLRARAFRWNNSGNHRSAQTAAEEALRMSPPGQDRLMAARRLVWACKFQGQLARAREVADQILEASADDPAQRADALRMKLFVAAVPPGDSSAIRLAEEALHLHRRSGRAGRVVRGINDLATALMLTRDYEAAIDRFADARRLATDCGMVLEALRAQLFTLVCEAEAGRGVGAPRDIESLATQFETSGLGGFRPLFDLIAGYAYVRSGDRERAVQQLQSLNELKGPPFSAEFAGIMRLAGLSLLTSRVSDEIALGNKCLIAAAHFYGQLQQNDMQSTCLLAAGLDPDNAK